MEPSTFAELIGDESLISSQLPLSILNVITSFAHGFNHVFASSQCHSNITVSERATVVRLQAQDGWSRRARCGHIMVAGKHFIEFQLYIVITALPLVWVLLSFSTKFSGNSFQKHEGCYKERAAVITISKVPNSGIDQRSFHWDLFCRVQCNPSICRFWRQKLFALLWWETAT